MKRRFGSGNLLLGLIIGLCSSAAAAPTVVLEPVGKISGPVDMVRAQGDRLSLLDETIDSSIRGLDDVRLTCAGDDDGKGHAGLQ